MVNLLDCNRYHQRCWTLILARLCSMWRGISFEMSWKICVDHEEMHCICMYSIFQQFKYFGKQNANRSLQSHLRQKYLKCNTKSFWSKVAQDHIQKVYLINKCKLCTVHHTLIQTFSQHTGKKENLFRYTVYEILMHKTETSHA